MSFTKLRGLYPNILSSTSPYPLTRDLHRQFVKRERGLRVLNNQFCVQVVSPELCDDTVHLLSPSLAEYRNCDVVDLYPGAGLWSSKIHELIQPQNHILVEPNSKYLPFLKPLLDKPGSTYRHLPWDPSIWVNHEKLVSEECLPRQAALPQSSGTVNRSLLVLLNLTHLPQVARNGRESLNFKVLSKMLGSMLSQTMLNQHGSVRILAWVTEQSQRLLLPRRAPERTSMTGLTAEKTARVTTVVSRDPYEEDLAVPYQQKLWSCRRALEASDRKGIIIPPHRRSVMYEEARRSLEEGQEVPVLGGPMFQSTNLWTSVWHDELFELMRELGLNEEAKHKFLRERRVGGSILEKSSNRSRLQDLRKHWRADQRHMAVIRTLVEREAELYRLEMSIKHGATDEERRSSKEQWLPLRNSQSRTLAQTISKSTIGTRLEGLRDTFWASIQEPPCLPWERRDHDPLIARTEEFWPQMPIALMDIQPKDLSIDNSWSDFVEYSSHWRMVMRAFMTCSAQSIGYALRHLAVGADDALIDRVPELTDPAHGGRIDPRDSMVRTLPCETLDKLFLAFEDWPLKPDHMAMQINQTMHHHTRHGL